MTHVMSAYPRHEWGEVDSYVVARTFLDKPFVKDWRTRQEGKGGA